MYNLTDSQKDLLRSIVKRVRDGKLGEEFTIFWTMRGPRFHDRRSTPANGFTRGKLEALETAELIQCKNGPEGSYTCITLLGRAYSAVDSGFDEPDTSFVRHLSPLADVTNLDDQVKQRCLPILGAGPACPALWDSAVRTATVILEERLRDVGTIQDTSIVGKTLVNRVFGGSGTLTPKFSQDSERESFRDLFAGVVGLFRNPSAHTLVDPAPEEGGAVIVFINVLLGKLEGLR